MSLLGGVDEESAPAFPVRWTGSWKTTLSSPCVTARACRLDDKAIRPIKLPVKDSGMSSTSIRRPLRRSAAAAFVGSEASGFVPAFVLDGGCSGFCFWLDGGERGGSVLLTISLSEVLPTFARDLCVIPIFYGVPCNNLYLHCLSLI
jgi:hypothetical protein